MAAITLQSANVSIDNIAALRTYEPVQDNQVVQVIYHTYKQHGGGAFFYDSTDTKSADDNGLVIVTAGGKRWKRILEAEEMGNILLWGADPSGTDDSSPAFKSALRSGATRTLVVPHEGQFKIDATITLGRVSLTGSSRDHFGQSTSKASLFAGKNLQGPMFDNVGKLVAGLAFDGRNTGKTCLTVSSYINIIKDCSFNAFDTAVAGVGGVDVSFIDNTFTYCANAIRSATDTLSTTCRFVRNQFQYCTDCIVYEGELWGSSFIDNIFERVKGRAIHAKVCYDNHFQGNWWENRDGAADAPCISTDMAQQMQRNTAASNHVMVGWIDVFGNASMHNNRMGGVMTGNGEVVVREPTGRAMRITEDTVRAECDNWTGRGDLNLETGRDDSQQRTGNLNITMGGNVGGASVNKMGNIIVSSKGTDTHWEGQLQLRKGQFSDAVYLNESYQISNKGWGGLVGTSDLKSNTAVRQATLAVPQQILYDNGPSTGTGLFTKVDDSEAGRVRFLAEDGLPQLRNFLAHCTVHDRGIICDGITPIDVYGGSWSAYRRAKGFDVWFVDRVSGQARTPSRFTLMLSHVEGNGYVPA